jgi:hypothetical protein
MRTLLNVKEANAPQRKYMRKDLEKIEDRHVKVQSTLLEYDQKSILLSGILTQQQQHEKESNSRIKQQMLDQQQAQQKQTTTSSHEEDNLKRLINEMSETDLKQSSKISANAVGQILGLQQSALQQIVSEFASKENEIQQEIEQLEKLLASGADTTSLGGFQHKQRLANILSKQIEQKETEISERTLEIDELKKNVSSLEETFSEVNICVIYDFE